MSQKTIHKPNTKQAKIPKKGESPKKSNTIQPPINEVVQENIEELKESYDNFLYVSKAFSNTNINSLQARGRLYGLSPASLKGARVLEIGSSCGGNIIPQELYYPETTFT
ncbi:methyltransferase, partial [Veillonella atypica]|nr:methyltransferase [Veillonella atypica]